MSWRWKIWGIFNLSFPNSNIYHLLYVHIFTQIHLVSSHVSPRLRWEHHHQSWWNLVIYPVKGISWKLLWKRYKDPSLANRGKCFQKLRHQRQQFTKTKISPDAMCPSAVQRNAPTNGEFGSFRIIWLLYFFEISSSRYEIVLSCFFVFFYLLLVLHWHLERTNFFFVFLDLWVLRIYIEGIHTLSNRRCPVWPEKPKKMKIDTWSNDRRPGATAGGSSH